VNGKSLTDIGKAADGSQWLHHDHDRSICVICILHDGFPHCEFIDMVKTFLISGVEALLLSPSLGVQCQSHRGTEKSSVAISTKFRQLL
jgi:hypothetical protein